MLRRSYERWLDGWETDLATRSTDRVVRPFEWGMEWVGDLELPGLRPFDGGDEAAWLAEANQAIIRNGELYFQHRTPKDFTLDGEWLRFTSPLETPYAENNLVEARWFPMPEDKQNRRKRAVLVLPHWNSHAQQHVALCRGFQKLGIPALRLSLPYHDRRMPPPLTRADYAVSSNIGRTMHATRQAVHDIRACVDWLEQQGFENIGIVGTSLGSAYAFLASSYDHRLKVNVFNHCSARFGDVVWTGLSTRHIKASLEQHLTLEQLQTVWDGMSPRFYMEQFARHQSKKNLFIYTTYDTTFLPRYSEEILTCVRSSGAPHKLVVLPCGHYTMGETPFKFIVGYHIISHVARRLG
ncbi:MAG: RcgR family putative quorum lactone hydrolase [Acidobacteriota bacterium]